MGGRKPEVSEFDSVDPAPPSDDRNVARLRETICNEEEKMFQRMRALFALRNIGGEDSVEALAAAFSSSVPFLIERLEDFDEDVMVRHEAAEALGAIGDRTALGVLERFKDDRDIVVAESCEVALDLLDWVASKRLDYSE